MSMVWLHQEASSKGAENHSVVVCGKPPSTTILEPIWGHYQLHGKIQVTLAWLMGSSLYLVTTFCSILTQKSKPPQLVTGRPTFSVSTEPHGEAFQFVRKKSHQHFVWALSMGSFHSDIPPSMSQYSTWVELYCNRQSQGYRVAAFHIEAKMRRPPQSSILLTTTEDALCQVYLIKVHN